MQICPHALRPMGPQLYCNESDVHDTCSPPLEHQFEKVDHLLCSPTAPAQQTARRGKTASPTSSNPGTNAAIGSIFGGKHIPTGATEPYTSMLSHYVMADVAPQVSLGRFPPPPRHPVSLGKQRLPSGVRPGECMTHLRISSKGEQCIHKFKSSLLSL